MPSFNPPFDKLKVRCDACGRAARLERHHLSREWLFINVLKKSKLAQTEWYKDLVVRYKEFREYDVRRICNNCHKDVHKHYNRFLRRWNKKHRHIPIEFYTVDECKRLMLEFRAEYFKWRKRRRNSLKGGKEK